MHTRFRVSTFFCELSRTQSHEWMIEETKSECARAGNDSWQSHAHSADQHKASAKVGTVIQTTEQARTDLAVLAVVLVVAVKPLYIRYIRPGQ
jgi:hypothetical protein